MSKLLLMFYKCIALLPNLLTHSSPCCLFTLSVCVVPSWIRFRKSNVAYRCFASSSSFCGIICNVSVASDSLVALRLVPLRNPLSPTLPPTSFLCPFLLLLTAFRLVSSKYSTFLHTTGNWLFIDSSSRKGQLEKDREREREGEEEREGNIERGRER